jgi:hypothetical protein
MPRVRPAAAVFAFVVLGATLLAGCGMGERTYADLERESTATDAPPDLPEYAWDGADPSTARFVGEHEGTRLWLARSEDAHGVCLVSVSDSAALEWVVGCSGAEGIETQGPGGTFRAVPDGAPSGTGTTTAVSTNVYAVE